MNLETCIFCNNTLESSTLFVSETIEKQQTYQAHIIEFYSIATITTCRSCIYEYSLCQIDSKKLNLAKYKDFFNYHITQNFRIKNIEYHCKQIDNNSKLTVILNVYDPLDRRTLHNKIEIINFPINNPKFKFLESLEDVKPLNHKLLLCFQ